MGGSFFLFYVKMYGILSGFVIYFRLLEYVLTKP